MKLFRYLIFIFLFLSSINIFAKDFFYYGNGQKIKLDKSNDWITIQIPKNNLTFIFDNFQNFGFTEYEVINPKKGIVLLNTKHASRDGLAKLQEATKHLKIYPCFELLSPSTSRAERTERLILFDEFTVKFKENIRNNEIIRLINEYELDVVSTRKENIYQLRLPEKITHTTLDIANVFYKNEITEWSTPNFIAEQILFSTMDINDPLFPDQWYLNNTGQSGGVIGCDINVIPAWQITQGSQDVIVAVVDDGVEDHEDFYTGQLVQGYTAVGGGNGLPTGTCWHGQCVAGIIAANHNGIGIRGISPNSKIMSIRTQLVGATTLQIADAIDHAWISGADILNLSWGYEVWYDDIAQAIRNANSNGRNGKGSLVVAAAGNTGSYVTFPASMSQVLAVGSVDDSHQPPLYTPRSALVDVVATSGYNNISTLDRMGVNGLVPGNYYTSFGQNSAAAPQVSGLASLIYSIDPNLTSAQIKNIIKTSSNDYGNLTWDGYGRINAYHALVLARGYGHITSDMTLCFDTEIKGDLIVDEGATLTVKPGVTLTFAANSDAANEGIYASLSELIVKGKVVFQGISAEPVVFQSASGQPQSWGGIRFENESDDNSVVSYCHIKDAQIGVYANSAHPDITDNEINNCMWGSLLNYSSSLVEDNYIHHNTGHGLMIWNGNSQAEDPLIKQNRIENNNANGIYANNSSPEITENKIKQNGVHGLQGLNQFHASIGMQANMDNWIFSNGSCGLHVSNNSIPELGTHIGGFEYNEGNNAVENNEGYEFYYTGGDTCEAYLNFWGAYPPDEEELYSTGISVIHFMPALEENPYADTDVPAKIAKLNEIALIEVTTSSFQKFLHYYRSKNYNAALALGVQLVDSLHQSPKLPNLLGL